jgi:uncharacterized protein YlxW (UPF0749 family)
MKKIESETKYKIPLTLEQFELLGELRSAQAKIKMLEEGRENLTRLIQELMREIKQKDKRWTTSNAKH